MLYSKYLVLSSPKRILSLLSRRHSHHYWNHFSSLFQCRWHVYVERQDKSHQGLLIDLMILKLTLEKWTLSHTTWNFEDAWILIFNGDLSVKYERNQLTVLSQKPIAFNFSNNILWSIVSGIFWRSMYI